MPYQLHEVIVIGVFPLIICDLSYKRRVLVDVTWNIYNALDIAVVIFSADICLKQTFSDRLLQIIRKQEQQHMEKPIILIGTCTEINDIREIKHLLQHIL